MEGAEGAEGGRTGGREGGTPHATRCGFYTSPSSPVINTEDRDGYNCVCVLRVVLCCWSRR